MCGKNENAMVFFCLDEIEDTLSNVSSAVGKVDKPV
jgi:predicted enzyme related to lactoylglutathione lyase